MILQPAKFSGTIENVEFSSTPEKAIVSLRLSPHELMFIEFLAKRSSYVVNYKQGDEVTIGVAFDGRRSKSTKKHYNNIVGRSIKPYLK